MAIKRRTLKTVAATLTISAALAHAGNAPLLPSVVQRFEIEESRPAFGGADFAGVGAYQLIRGKATVRVRPEHAANSGIVDLQYAPKTAEGDVRYTTDVVILRPQNAENARRLIIAEVPNRGMRIALDSLNGADAMRELAAMMQGKAPGPAYASVEAAGGGFLYRRGYTLVWVGWQADVSPPTSLLRASFPVATEGGEPITGRVEATVVFDTTEPRSAIPLAYPIAPGSDNDAVLTVRARPNAAPRTLPRTSWHLDGPRRVQVDRPADFDAGAIYQFTYKATDPVVAGLGFAATRDVIAFLRRGEPDASGAANPLADLRTARCAFTDPERCLSTRKDAVDLVVGIGSSQSGRYLRDLIWQGFNNDGIGRRVFDGVLVQIAGGRRSFTNRRWAEPGRFSRQHEDPLVYGNQFPFGYATLTDPVTGRRDSLLEKCEQNRICPKVFHIDGSSEFWNAGASLVANDGAGQDVPLPASVRSYLIAGAPHAPTIVNASSLLPPNPLNSAGISRALIVAMDKWLSAGVEPPASRWPSLAKGELAPPRSQAAVGFPTFAGLPYSGVANPVVATDYDAIPPKPDPAKPWQILVPTTDADGNDRAGIRLPDFAAPTGTYLGWNPRKSGYAEGDLSFVFGSYVPFAATSEARRASGDPRLSLAERYAGDEMRRRQLEAKQKLIAERLYLDADK